MSQKFTDWDETAGNNTTIGTGAIDIAEGWAAANVNNALREVMAAAVRSAGLPGLSGTSRPAGTQAGQFWFDTTTATAPLLMFYDGTDDILCATFDFTANTVLFAAAAGAGLANVVEDLTPQLGAALDVNGFSITSASNADVTISPNGTGNIILDADDVFIETDIVHTGDVDTKIVFGTDTQSFETGGSSRLDISDSGVRMGGANARVTTVLDEDAMGTDSATALATQQSIKAYVDAQVAAVSATTLGHWREQQTAGTAGGTFTAGAWRTRGLATEVTNTISGASLAANQITLAAGTYDIDAHAVAFRVDGHVAKLYNITDGMEGDKVEDPESVYAGKRMRNGWKNWGLPWTYGIDPERVLIEEGSSKRTDPDQ